MTKTLSRYVLRVLLLFGFLSQALAFFNSIPTSSGYAGTLGAGASTGSQRLAGFQNPAAHNPESKGFSLNYYQPFAMEGVNVSEVILHRDKANYGLGANYHQTQVADLYLEQSLGVQVSGNLFSIIQLGVSNELRRLEIKYHGSNIYFGNSFGFIARLNTRFSLGFFLRDPFPIFSPESSNPMKFQTGATLKTKYSEISYDVCRNIYGKWSNLLGQKIKIGEYLKLALGIADSPYRFSLGIQIKTSVFRLNSAVQQHERLSRTQYYGFSGLFKGESTK